MKIIALDTSTRFTQVAAYDGLDQSVVFDHSSSGVHSEALLLQISNCLAQKHWVLQDLNGIVCGSGPGSFTGLRIGLSTAKGLAFSLGIPLCLISSLDALSDQAQGQGPVLACVTASVGKVYAKFFPRALPAQKIPRNATLFIESVWDPFLLTELLLPMGNELTVCGDGPLQCMELVENRVWIESKAPSMLHLAKRGFDRFSAGSFDSTSSSVPNYALASAAEQQIQKKIEK